MQNLNLFVPKMREKPVATGSPLTGVLVVEDHTLLRVNPTQLKGGVQVATPRPMGWM